MTELLDVLHRPGLARFLDPGLRTELIGQLLALGVLFTPAERVTDCRDPKDNKCLELALASGAEAIVSSDTDLRVLHPWRGRASFDRRPTSPRSAMAHDLLKAQEGAP